MAKAKVRSKDLIEVDLTGVSASDRRRKVVIPEGTYRAKVVSATGKKFSTGSRGAEWVFEITDKGKGKGARFWYNNVLVTADGDVAENNLWSFRGVLQALSPAIKIPDSMIKVPMKKMVGRTCALEIADGEDNEGKLRSEIIDVFNESLLDGEDEEDEMEDEVDDFDEDEDEEEDDEEFDLDEDEL